MSDTIVLLQLEHGTILRLLRILDSQRLHLESGQDPNYELLKLLFTYFRDYPDACHHPKEDQIFRALQRRHPDVAHELEDLLGDHEAIDALTRRVAAVVEEASVDDSGPARAALRAALREFLDEYLRHVRMEEENFFPVAQTALTREDWDLIDFSMFEIPDPIYDESAENRFRKLRELIYREAGPEDDSGQRRE